MRRHVLGALPRLKKPSAQRNLSLSVPFNDYRSDSESSRADDLLLEKSRQLEDALTHQSPTTRVWDSYRDLVSYLGHDGLPLNIHQRVLRKCTPQASTLRRSELRLATQGSVPNSVNPHAYEERFRAIFRNISTAGTRPSLEDYNFVLEQFTALGHHKGVVQVLGELVEAGHTPTHKTYGLCMQAIAHRLVLPCPPQFRAQRRYQCRSALKSVLLDMRQRNVKFTSVLLDLTLRILRETLDVEAFETLLKWGYGIDLSNPDRPPVDFLNQESAEAGSTVSDTLPAIPHPLPFSTAALNTTVKLLGSAGNVSKMVQAFEVLTTPIPGAQQHLSRSFDDDDDFGVSSEPEPPLSSPTPFATPNTTTFNTVIRHVSQAGNSTLARHYLLHAMSLDRRVSQQLRVDLRTKKLTDISSPHFALNRGMLLSVFGDSNRDKDLGLMKWLDRKLPGIIREKRKEVRFIKNFYEALQKPAKQKTRGFVASFGPPSPNKPPAFVRVYPPSQPAKLGGLAREIDGILSLNVEDSSFPPKDSAALSPEPFKALDLRRHLSILMRTLAELNVFKQSFKFVFNRTVQRMKERTGRRVWENKDVFLWSKSDTGALRPGRRVVSKEDWTKMVRFRPREGSHNMSHAALQARRQRRIAEEKEKRATTNHWEQPRKRSVR